MTGTAGAACAPSLVAANAARARVAGDRAVLLPAARARILAAARALLARPRGRRCPCGGAARRGRRACPCRAEARRLLAAWGEAPTGPRRPPSPADNLAAARDPGRALYARTWQRRRVRAARAAAAADPAARAAGAAVRAARRARGWRQRDLAAAAGTSQPAVYLVERGVRHGVVGPGTWARVTAALGLPEARP